MYFKSKHVSLVLLGLTAIVCSRLLFVFINDPEGPNLFIVGMAALAVYLMSLGVYVGFLPSSLKGFARILAVLIVQILLVIAGFFILTSIF
ncbi:MAG TPA: hypothetical protein VG984_02300 [Candidatus Paceibacterota bacterium]|nr:hypothetical protein [Candidatus Paceibacterota bacterium]